MATLTDVAVRAITIDDGVVTDRGKWITWKDDLYCGYRSSTRKSTIQFRAYLSEPCTSITLKVTPYGYSSTSSSVYYFKASANEQDPVLELGALNITTTEYDVKNTDTKRNYSIVTVTINGNFKAGYIYVYAWANNTNKWLAGDDDYPTKIMSATSATAYSLSISQGANSTIAVSRTSSNLASTGTLANGAKLYSGDKLKITFSAAAGYNVGTHTVNGSAFTSGGTHTVSGDVKVVSTATLKTYTVSYNANGGSGAPAAQTKNHGKDLTLSSTKPSRAGYTFQGWGTSASDTTVDYAAGAKYTEDEAITLYAIWKINTYTVSYNANGGTGAPDSQPKTHGKDLTLSITKPTKASVESARYTVNFNAKGGICNTQSLQAIRTTKYTFSKWNTKADGSGTSYNSGGTYTANEAATLYAQYTSTASTASITLPTPTRDGYEFLGWSTDSGAESGITGVYTPSSNVTLYAIWKANGLIYRYTGSGWEAYQIYRDTGSGWELYALYRDTGTGWEMMG